MVELSASLCLRMHENTHTEFHVTKNVSAIVKRVGYVRIPGSIFFHIRVILTYELTLTSEY